MVEGARLESVFRGNSNVGSTPTLSATNSFVFNYLQLTAKKRPKTHVTVPPKRPTFHCVKPVIPNNISSQGEYTGHTVNYRPNYSGRIFQYILTPIH